MHSQKFIFSYFSLQLFDYISHNHPDKQKDYSLIKQRGDLAAELYEKSMLGGLSQTEALEVAYEALYKGFGFSLFNLIQDALWEDFSKEVPADMVYNKALEYCRKFEDLCIKYEVFDEFEDDDAYFDLYIEMIGAIKIDLEEYGI